MNEDWSQQYYRKDEPIHPGRWVALAVWLVAFTLVVAVGFKILAIQVDRNSAAKDALCAQRANLRDQIDSQTKYLRDIHTGKRTPIPGVSEADILQTIDRERAAIRAYDRLHCSSRAK